jgi:hypothetical protein
MNARDKAKVDRSLSSAKERARVRYMLTSAKSPRSFVHAVRHSIDAKPVLRELAERDVILALTTTAKPRTADDLQQTAERLAKELIP